MMREFELAKILGIPEERISVGKYLIGNQLERGISGLKWVGGYGSFWEPRIARIPKDIDIALDIDPNSLDLFNQCVGRTLYRYFGLPLDLFPVHMIVSKYGKHRARELIERSTTLHGIKPDLH